MKAAHIIFLLLVASSLRSQQNNDSLLLKTMEEVVVTATRSPRLLANVAIPASVISAKTIYQSGSLRLNDILSEQTGIVVTDNFGKGIQMQGLSSEYTLVLLNGEPLIGRTGGVFDLSRISIRGIKKIEIIKGPSSSLYGSEAMGGVINIITDQSGIKKTDLNLRYGRFNTMDGSVEIGRKIQKLDIQFSSNFNKSEGYSLKPNALQKTVEPFQRFTSQLSLSQPIGEKWKIVMMGRQNHVYINNTIAVQNGGNTIVSKGFEKNNEYNFNPSVQYNNGKLTSAVRGYFTGFTGLQELQVKDATGGYDDQFKQRFSRIENQTDWHFRKASSVTAGAGYIFESVQSNRYDSMSTKRKNSIAYFFLQHEEKVADKLTFIGGVRYDANKAYASVLSPKAAFQYKFSEKVSFNISYGKGFKAPDFRQLYLNFTNLAAGAYSVFGTEVARSEVKRLSDQNLIEQTTSMFNALSILKPEVSGGINMGARFHLPYGVDANINFFRNDISNMIVTDVIAFKKSGGQIFGYFNLKKALTQGFEFEAKKKINKNISIKTGYQYLYTADKEVISAIKKGDVFQRNLQSGLASRMGLSNYGGLPFRSKHNANVKLVHEVKSGLFSTLRILYRSRWGVNDIDGNGLINRSDEYANGFVQMNASMGYKHKSNWDIMTGVDNIFNYKDLQHLPGNPGRVGYINFQIHF